MPTTGVLLAPCHDEFHGSRSDYVRQWFNSPCESRPNVPTAVYALLGLEVLKQMFRSGGESDMKSPFLRF
ncbi:hypothetical protein TNCV_3070811 [Trichonephila clavipes]|nr:hypothetical protein TNCV_3070811 [Trichonephila clavipes]